MRKFIVVTTVAILTSIILVISCDNSSSESEIDNALVELEKISKELEKKSNNEDIIEENIKETMDKEE